MSKPPKLRSGQYRLITRGDRLGTVVMLGGAATTSRSLWFCENVSTGEWIWVRGFELGPPLGEMEVLALATR